ncbi:hypothetical protein ACFQ8E_13105 [Isoptericola sp. NPDC056573]|uniref:hypothetical protein n=1 Tax=Isoptericola sp. NPDC056573 TaxID=3345868 RepID=UPI0036792D6E
MSTVLKRVFANPQVTPAVVLVLLLVALVTVPRALDAATDRQRQRELEQAQTWIADRWVFTTADFPAHDTAELPVERWWLDRGLAGAGWLVEPVRATGIAPLFHAPFALTGGWSPESTSGISGVRVDGVDVYSYVATPPGAGFDTARGSDGVWRLQEEASRVADYLLDPGSAWEEYRGTELLSVAYVGTPAGPRWYEDHLGEPFDAGGPGYFGVEVHERADDDLAFRTTTIGTVVEGSLAVVGVVVPDGVVPPAELEPALLLERLSQELRSHPPSPTDTVGGAVSGTDRGAQADSRTTREVGSVMAAGS